MSKKKKLFVIVSAFLLLSAAGVGIYIKTRPTKVEPVTSQCVSTGMSDCAEDISKGMDAGMNSLTPEERKQVIENAVKQ
jgi:hypothetical protein